MHIVPEQNIHPRVDFGCIFSASPGNPTSRFKTHIYVLTKMSGFGQTCADFYWISMRNGHESFLWRQ